jgi:hypothetical protein
MAARLERPVPVAILFQTAAFAEVVRGFLRGQPGVAIVASGRTWPLVVQGQETPRVVIVERARILGRRNASVAVLLLEGPADRIIICSIDDPTTTILAKRLVSNIDLDRLVAEITSPRVEASERDGQVGPTNLPCRCDTSR